MPFFASIQRRDAMLTGFFLLLSIALYFIPNSYEQRVNANAERVRGEVLAVDNSDINQYGMVKQGEQEVSLKILDGRFAGREVEGANPLLGMMHRDTIFKPGDIAYVVLSLDEAGEILYVNPQSHYRIGKQLILLGMFAGLLLLFGGFTGAKALLSFLFTALALWKILVPGLLHGYDPLMLSIAVVTGLTAAIIFLVAGPTRLGVVAFSGALLGVLTSCLLAMYFTSQLHVNGTVMPFAETMLYAGYGHLNLTRIFVAAVFLAASGAVMDLAMDVAASMNEVFEKRPDISLFEGIRSGITVGRAVVGTMTTTLLFAYSGGYITLLMAFMAQGVPLGNLFNLNYVAAEALKTLVGSFGLVMVAPFTAVVGAFVYSRRPKAAATQVVAQKTRSISDERFTEIQEEQLELIKQARDNAWEERDLKKEGGQEEQPKKGKLLFFPTNLKIDSPDGYKAV